MKSFFVYISAVCSLGIGFGFGSIAHAKDKAKFAVLSLSSAEQFEQKQKALLKDAAEEAEPILLAADKPMAVDDKLVSKALESLPTDVQILYVDFNFKMQESWKPVVEILNQKAEKGLLIVGSAGVAGAKEVSVQLNRSFLGQLKRVILVGELTERERLLPGSFYGPELMTAVKPPRDWIGQGFAPILFASRMASHIQRHKQDDWISYLASRKSKSKKLWAELEDFFPR